MKKTNILQPSILFFLLLNLSGLTALSQGVMITNDPAAPDPAALLQTYGLGTGEGNVLFMGEWKGAPGPLPATDAGTRLLWYPDKAVFRAGRVNGTQWNNENVGDYSSAFGFNSIASNTYTMAWGENTTAAGLSSTAFGWNTNASGFYSTALGSGTLAPSANETVIGRNNTEYTPLGSSNVWNSADRLFVIGNGVSISDRNDALVMLKNGNLGLGTSSPTQRLEVAGSIYGQSSNWAIRGLKTGTTGTFPGVWGETESGSANANGIRGFANNTTSGTGSAGVFGKNFSTTNANYGVFGEAVSVSGRGVYGYASSATGTNYGVYGRSDSWDGYGVFGQNLSSFGAAGKFEGTNIGLRVSANGDNNGNAFALYVKSLGAPINDNKYGGVFEVDNGNGLSYALYARAFSEQGIAGVFEGNLWAGYFSGDVIVTGDFYNPSDNKLKKNIRHMDKSLERILKLDAKIYENKTDEYEFMNLAKGPQFGFIAQELEAVFPELVRVNHHPGPPRTEEEEGIFYEPVEYKGINYIGMIPVLVEAIKELNAVVEAQNKRIEELEREKQ